MVGVCSAREDFPTDHVTPRNGEASGLHVVVLWDGGSASASVTSERPLVIGRSKECDIVIDHPSVSRRHARFSVASGTRIEDLGSANGTRVRGARVSPHLPVPFRVGDLVEIGRAVLVVQVGSTRPPPAGAGEAASKVLSSASPVVIEDPQMRDLDRLLHLVAQSDISIVFLGETGAGKEVFAERAHRLSRRAAGPFLRLNCAALSETLLESELFGHARGAFTGAVGAKIGLFEAAKGGTILLDEVGELTPSTQAKVLRVLESGELIRVGEVAPRPVDVRVLAATNQDLWGLVAAGRFRADVYFRLDGITLTIPPLRQRRGEILPLAQLFLRRAAERARRPAPLVSPEASRILQEHSWPGNVRELRNTIERAFVVAGHGDIQPSHLRLDRPSPIYPPEAEPVSSSRESPVPPSRESPVPSSRESQPDGPATQRSPALREDMDAFERRRILAALEQCRGNQSRAAEVLGISRRTLTNRLNVLGLPRPRKGRAIKA